MDDTQKRVAEIIEAMASPDYLSTVPPDSDIDWGTSDLIEVGSPVVPQLIENIERNRGFIYMLGQIGDARAVEPLLAQLHKEIEKGYPHLAGHVLALGEIGDPRAVADLLQLLDKTGVLPIVQAYVMEALGQIGDPRAIEPLRAVLRQTPRHPYHDGAERALQKPERSQT